MRKFSFTGPPKIFPSAMDINEGNKDIFKGFIGPHNKALL